MDYFDAQNLGWEEHKVYSVRCATCRYWGGARILASDSVFCKPSQDGPGNGTCMKRGYAYNYESTYCCAEHVPWCSGNTEEWCKDDAVDMAKVERAAREKARLELIEQLRGGAGSQSTGFWWSEIKLDDITMPRPDRVGAKRGPVETSTPGSAAPSSLPVAEPRMDPLFKKLVWGLVVALVVAYFVVACQG